MTTSTALHASLLSTMWPCFAVMAYFIAGFTIFSARTWVKGMPVDIEVVGRPASAMLSRYFRHYIMWLLSPWQRLVVMAGITPNMLTFASLLAALGAGVAAAVGNFALAGWLYILCGILDILDGRVARIRQQVTASGAFFDSVIDRYAELFVFGGMTVFYKDSWVLYAVMLASLGSLMVSYTRARGESLGVTNLNIGVMQRPERLVYLGVSMVFAPLVEAVLGHGVLPVYALVVAGTLLLAVSTNLTAVRRIRHTMAILDAAQRPVHAPVVVQAPAAAPEPRPEVRAERPMMQSTPVSVGKLMPLRAAGSSR